MQPEVNRPGRINWLASYPKSGNTWLRLLLGHALGDEEVDINGLDLPMSIASSNMLFDRFTPFEVSELTAQEVALLQPEVFKLLSDTSATAFWLKIHDARIELCPADPATGTQALYNVPMAATHSAVYIIRNPLDVAVSNAFHDGHEDLDRAVKKLNNTETVLSKSARLQARQPLLDWTGHVQSWLDRPDLTPLVIRYEDMLADTPAVLRTVLDHTCPDHEVSDAQIRHAVEMCRFERLQGIEAETGFRERLPKQKKFFRAGRAGTGRESLSEAQIARILECHGETMRRFGYLE